MVTINRALLAMCLAGLPAAVAQQTGTAGHHGHGSAQQKQTQQMGSTEQRQISTVEAQQILKEKGFYDGPIDGIAGPRTQAALREYQRCSGNLSVTGQLDQQTMQHMAMSLSTDEEGEGVRARSGEPMQAQEPVRLPVRHIQTVLRDKGLYKGSIDGIAGPKTRAAIRQYQQQENLQVTGRLDQQTLQHMVREEEEVRARIGEPGSAAGAPESGQKMQMSVHEAQRVLKDEGLYQGRIDGIAGPQTRAALREFQQRQNLPVTGRLDQQTMQQLNMEGERGRTVTPEEQQKQQHEHHEQQQQDDPQP